MNISDSLEPQEYLVTRADLVAYAAASGDQNPIHQDEQVAISVGLPGVIAHGMYTLALVARAVAHWTGDAEVVQIGAKFTNPVLVPEHEGATVTISGTVKDISDDVATLALEVTCAGQKVLGMPKAVVRV